MKHIYIVAIAGSGRRMGLDSPKQFLEFDGEPIFIKTLRVIANNSSVDEIIIVTKEEYIDRVRTSIAEFGITKVEAVVPGGRERQDSIYNAIKTIKDIDRSIVGVQDGVRPFIKDDFIDDCYDALMTDEGLDGVVVGVPVKDTIKKIDESGVIVETPARSSLMAAQTPQVFRGAVIKRAYDEAKKRAYLGTDDASLVELIGGVVRFVQGSYENIKITTIEDLLHFSKGR